MVDSPSHETTSPIVKARRDPNTGRPEITGVDVDWVEQIHRFLDALEARGLSVNTILAYAYDIVVLSRWLASTQRKLELIEESDLLDFIKVQRASGAVPTTINRRLTTIDALYQFVTGERVPRRKAVSAATPNRIGRGYDRLGVRHLGSSARRALRVKEPETLIAPLTTEQVKDFITTFDRYRDLTIFYLMLMCGLRSCEVLAIEIDDVDADSSSLRVRGKGNKQRMVPIPRAVSSAMAAYIRLERPRHCLTTRLFVVFKGSRRGCPMTRAGLRSLFRSRRQQPLLKDANPHRLRHTFGTQMARAGVRMPAIKKLMGHADANTTLRYINLSLADVADAFHQASEKIRRQYEQ